MTMPQFPLLSTLKTFILLIIWATSLHIRVTAQLPTNPSFLEENCDENDAGTYTANSSYNTNLNSVLFALISHASAAAFYNSSTGLADGPDTAYGQYYCRGDISAELCRNCVKAAAHNVSAGGVCFRVKEGTIYYKECTLLYGNRSRYGVREESLGGYVYSDFNVSDPVRFNRVLGNITKMIIKKAAYGDRSKCFATGEGYVTQLETLYSLVQCSPDIRGTLCENCLQSSLRDVGQCCGDDAQWVYVYYPNCRVMYSITQFYYNSTAPQRETPVPPSETPNPPSEAPNPTLSPPASHRGVSYYVTRIVVPVVAGSILILGGVWIYLCGRKIHVTRTSQIEDARPEENEIGNIEYFGLRAIERATSNFSLDNKLGQGGFGAVYKGMLPTGQLVAIKRLSRISSQGIREFKTEVAVVAKLRHRNLVRLLGYCIEQEEQILVYEFLPNLSLDKFLFDDTKSVDLDWKTRYRIIEGIARGVQYLHIDSLLTIVHRDLKSSNILLDKEMNPKIADFGLAKLVKLDETAGDTSRIAGTYGYMAPEYALTGRFSTKSDIYSFGVIILEILSGKRANRFYDPITDDGLLRYAWRLWNERRIEGITDPILQNNYSKIEVEKCARVGLLCVQDDTTRRPTIRAILGMLENQSLEFPSPSVPSFGFNGNETISKDLKSGSGLAQPSQVEDLSLSSSLCAR